MNPRKLIILRLRNKLFFFNLHIKLLFFYLIIRSDLPNSETPF